MKKIRSYKGKNNPNYKHGYYCGNPRKCLQCGNSITSGSKLGYCYICSKQKERNSNFKHGKHCFPNYCKICKTEIDYRATYCWTCYIISNFGKNNPNYVNGKSKEPYTLEFSKQLKESIRKRDNFTCQLCNQKGKTIHHIDYNKENCKEDNLITLCQKCNSIVNGNRNYWYAYFRYIMENK